MTIRPFFPKIGGLYMTRTLSSQKFIGLVVAVMVVLIMLWFIVPIVGKQIRYARHISKNYIVATKLSPEVREQTEQSIRDIEDAIKRGDTGEEGIASHYTRLGGDFEMIGRFDLAIDAYNKAADHDIAASVPYARMGAIYARVKDYEEAKDAFQMAITKNPKEPFNYEQLATIYWKELNQVAVARGVFIQGLMGTNQEKSLVRAYASFLDQAGYMSESLMYWQVVLSQSPNDQFAKDRIKALDSLKGR